MPVRERKHFIHHHPYSLMSKRPNLVLFRTKKGLPGGQLSYRTAPCRQLQKSFNVQSRFGNPPASVIVNDDTMADDIFSRLSADTLKARLLATYRNGSQGAPSQPACKKSVLTCGISSTCLLHLFRLSVNPVG